MQNIKIGSNVFLVCYWDEPTYANVHRPKFLVLMDVHVLKWDTKKQRVSLQRQATNSPMHWFAYRVCLTREEVPAICKSLSAYKAQEHASQANPDVWLDSKRSVEQLAKSARTAQQYLSGDYDIIFQSNSVKPATKEIK